MLANYNSLRITKQKIRNLYVKLRKISEISGFLN